MLDIGSRYRIYMGYIVLYKWCLYVKKSVDTIWTVHGDRPDENQQGNIEKAYTNTMDPY